jgi:hypothetical protein
MILLVALVAIGGYVVTRFDLFLAFTELFKDARRRGCGSEDIQREMTNGYDPT